MPTIDFPSSAFYDGFMILMLYHLLLSTVIDFFYIIFVQSKLPVGQQRFHSERFFLFTTQFDGLVGDSGL